MTQHKWHREIKAFVDGVEVEFRRPSVSHTWARVDYVSTFDVDAGAAEFRIKPAPVVLYATVNVGGAFSCKFLQFTECTEAFAHNANVKFTIIGLKITAVELLTK